MFSLDLKDAYFQMLIYPESRPYLSFVVDGVIHRFKNRCHGLSSAPRSSQGCSALYPDGHTRGALNDSAIWMIGYDC